MAGKRVVLVTGCSHGLGTLIAMQFASDPRRCYHVWAAVRCHEERSTMTNLAGDYLNDTLEICEIDLTVPSTITASVERIMNKYGRIDILVCNAGMTFFCPLEHLDFPSGRKVMQINFHGHARLMHMVIPGMKERRFGRIINIGSVGAIGGIALFSDFFVGAKCAMENLNDNLNAQLRSYNIRLSIVQPAAMKTDNPQKVLKRQNYGEMVRLPETDEITDALLKEHMETLRVSFDTDYAQEPIEVAKKVKSVVEDDDSKALYQSSYFGTQACLGWLKDATGESMVKRISASIGL